jgi:hypothetical protein
VPRLGCESKLLAVAAEHAEQSRHLGECLPAGLLHGADRFERTPWRLPQHLFGCPLVVECLRNDHGIETGDVAQRTQVGGLDHGLDTAARADDTGGDLVVRAVPIRRG